MRLILSIFFLATFVPVLAQNNASLASTDGKVFKVYANGKSLNAITQAQVLIEQIKQDTLQIEIEFENKKKFPATLYLLEQGQHCQGKEFNYKVECDDVSLNLVFTGVYDIIPLPTLLVPKKPVIDTSQKYKNKVFGHFFEMKDGKPVYFNNRPKQGACVNAMPDVYLEHAAFLMTRAEVAEHKFIIVENICRNNCYSVQQLNALLSYIDFEIEKLKLVRLAYPGLVDPENRKELEKSFKLESAKNELYDFLKTADESKTQQSGSCATAASEMLIDAYVQKLSNSANDTERYETLQKGAAELCYSSAQVARLLSKFIHDREKLDAAKLLYFYCVDKTNYSKVAEVFSYNQSISELNDFIEKQR